MFDTPVPVGAGVSVPRRAGWRVQYGDAVVTAGSERQRAFEREAMPHTRNLLQMARRLTRDPAAAEDLVQDALVNAWRGFDRFEHGTNCKGWLFRILFNLSNQRRDQRRRKPPMVTYDAADDAANTPTTSAPDHDRSRDVLMAVDRLSLEHREVLLLTVVEGFTCREAADLLAVPIGTVMSRLSRARAELRHQLPDYQP